MFMKLAYFAHKNQNLGFFYSSSYYAIRHWNWKTQNPITTLFGEEGASVASHFSKNELLLTPCILFVGLNQKKIFDTLHQSALKLITTAMPPIDDSFKNYNFVQQNIVGLKYENSQTMI